jgi:hypothetical protein
MLSRKAFVLLFAILLVSPGCSDSPATPPSNDDAIGRYVLKIISGRTLPYARSADVVITDGTIFLSGDGTYSSAVHQTVTQNGTSVVQTVGLPEGSWSRLNNKFIRLTPVKGDELSVEAQLIIPSLNFKYTDTDWGYVKQ